MDITKNWLVGAQQTAPTYSIITLPAFAKQTVKVGMSGGYVPFTFSEKDVLQGFEVDLWNEIALRSDYDVKFFYPLSQACSGCLKPAILIPFLTK